MLHELTLEIVVTNALEALDIGHKRKAGQTCNCSANVPTSETPSEVATSQTNMNALETLLLVRIPLHARLPEHLL